MLATSADIIPECDKRADGVGEGGKGSGKGLELRNSIAQHS